MESWSSVAVEVVEAFEILSDATKRQRYDEDLQRSGSLDGREAQEHQEQAADVFGLPDRGLREWKIDENDEKVAPNR